MTRTALQRAESALIDAANAIDELSCECEHLATSANKIAQHIDAAMSILSYVGQKAEADESYERAAARALNNDFADTNGRDWR